jgi:hypothetical protein
LRPWRVRTSHPDAQLVWISGEYNEFTDPTSITNLVVWPKADWASDGDATIAVEATFTGGNDVDLYVAPGAQPAAGHTRPVAAYAGFWSGDTSRKTLWPGATVAAELGGKSAMRVMIGGVIRANNGGSHTILSNWDAVGSFRQVLIRFNSSRQLQVYVETAAGTKTVVATDLTYTVGAEFGICVAYSSANGLRVWLNGTKSSVTATGASNIQNAATPVDLMAGASPHEATGTWQGQLWLVAMGEAENVSLLPASITILPVTGRDLTMRLKERVALPSALIAVTS